MCERTKELLIYIVRDTIVNNDIDIEVEEDGNIYRDAGRYY